MSLRIKLVSAIAAFMMVLGIFVVAVLAASQASVNLGGSLSFVADDVVARVTGSVTGAQVNPQNLDVTYSSGETVGDETVWEDLNLNFIDHKTAIVFSFTVENLSTERSLTLTFTDNIASNANFTKDVKRDGAAYINEKVKLDAKAEGDTTNKTSFTVTFTVANGDTSFNNLPFDYELKLYDESVAPKPVDFTVYEFATSGNEATLLSYTGTETNLVMPSSFSIVDGKIVEGIDYTITALGTKAFANCEELTSIIIPEGVTSIDDEAFSGCTNLTKVVLPEGMISIGHWAFYDCTNLAEINLPDSVTTIEGGVFYNCQSLTEIIIPEGVKRISAQTFIFCESLEKIIIPNSVTTIENGAFSYCQSLAHITIPDGVTYIDAMVFSDCTSLAEIIIPEGVTAIDMWAFYNCKSLTQITIPSKVTGFGEFVFSNCSNLKTVFVDSQAVAAMLSSKSAAGNLINYATTVYVSESAASSLPAEFTSIFSEVTPSGEAGYKKYTAV